MYFETGVNCVKISCLGSRQLGKALLIISGWNRVIKRPSTGAAANKGSCEEKSSTQSLANNFHIILLLLKVSQSGQNFHEEPKILVCKLYIFEKLVPILFVFNVCLNQISQPILNRVNNKNESSHWDLNFGDVLDFCIKVSLESLE